MSWMLRSRWLPSRAVLCTALAASLGGCPHRSATDHPQPPASASATTTAAPTATATTQPTTDPAALEQAIERRASQMEAMAREAEPSVTALLQRLASEAGGELIKLKYRLKTHSSIVRKMHLRLARDPSLTPPAVILDDTLRYTMQVVDAPPGRHVAAVKRVVTALEAEGQELVRLKNYWPADDNYSGCNSSLRTASGMLWELQFHTPESAATSDRTRDWYEELRREDTPLDRKRQLFDLMTAEWSKVPVPKGILDAGALHPRGEIIDRPKPQ